MNWCASFELRLQAWHRLRDQVKDIDRIEALKAINSWWRMSPWRPYHLHWDEQSSWPDPWQLLSDNIFCDLARGLGIMYTVTMLDRPDIQNAQLVETSLGNLVLIDQGKYVLNWDQDLDVNIDLEQQPILHQIIQSQFRQQLL